MSVLMRQIQSIPSAAFCT